MFDPVGPPSLPFNAQAVFGVFCTVLLFGGVLLWFATDFNHDVFLLVLAGQIGLSFLQLRAWIRQRRQSKVPATKHI